MIKQLVKRVTANFGYQTDKKQILILSDDWGSVRLKSFEARESLRKKGIDVDDNRFDQFDCLESNKDLEYLFEVLSKHRDRFGNPACITPVTNVTNPDFKAIKENGFSKYVFEKNTDTYKKYPNSDRVYDLIKEGIKEKMFIPQSHAREHIQVDWWMDELKNPDSMARKVFEEEFCFLSQPYLTRKDIRSVISSLDAIDEADFENVKNITKSGIALFEEIYGYKPVYLCAPATFHPIDIEDAIRETGLEWLDSPRIQRVNQLNKKDRVRFRYLGQKSKHGFKYFVRNAVFETNFSPSDDGIDFCLRGVKEAFDCRQPAIISNHRASFVGGIVEENRTKGLKSLDKLLGELLKQWPDAEFVTITDL